MSSSSVGAGSLAPGCVRDCVLRGTASLSSPMPDYPRDTLTFFAPRRPRGRTTRWSSRVPEEQLNERLGDGFRELDASVLVDWADGHREAVLLLVEGETEPRRFSPHRLAHHHRLSSLAFASAGTDHLRKLHFLSAACRLSPGAQRPI